MPAVRDRMLVACRSGSAASTSRIHATMPDADEDQPGGCISNASSCGDCGALGGTRTPNLLIRRELRAHPPPGHTSVDLQECCSGMRNNCRRYAALCGQNPASMTVCPGHPDRPTNVKPGLTWRGNARRVPGRGMQGHSKITDRD